MRNALPGLLQRGGVLSAASVSAQVNVSRFTDAGRVRTNDLLTVSLTGAQVAGGPAFAKAGFWLVRDRDAGSIILQFRPSLSADLAGIAGFNGDLNLQLRPDGALDAGDFTRLGSPAKELVAAVVASAPQLVAASTLRTGPDVISTQAWLVEALQRIRTAAQSVPDTYFNTVRQVNAKWIGISLSMFVNSVSDPVVRLRTRSAGAGELETATWEDADLRAFMLRAKELGFKVYLTLALEDPAGDSASVITAADPRCKTPQAPINRFVMGNPVLNNAHYAMNCLAAADYWWAPSHPLYATNVAAFWNSYSAIALKYARMAQETGVGLYSLGTETEWLFRARAGGGTSLHFGNELRQMMAQVRSVYTGPVTYNQHVKVFLDARSTFAGGEWGPYLAADLGLDAVALSVYLDRSVPSVPGRVLSVAELEQAMWQPVFTSTLRPLKARYPTLPLIFTEFGVVNDLGAPYFQANRLSELVGVRDSQGVTDGMRQQGNIYQALFNVNEREGNLVAGTFIWARYIAPVGCEWVIHDYTCSQPAIAALSSAYSRSAARDAQRVFNWAEQQYRSIFPGTGTAGSVDGYVYRYYSATNTYIAYKDGRVIVHNGREYVLQDVGPVTTFLDGAAQAGY